MDITQFVVSLVGLVFAALAMYAVPYIKLKLGAEQWTQLQSIVYVAVHAAEQLGVNKVIKDKYEYAADKVKAELARLKIQYDDDTIRAAIEAAVRQNFPKK